MNARERFVAVTHFDPIDRVPLHEEEIRQEVLDRWHGEGLPEVRHPSEVFGLDRWEKAPVNLGMVPRFKGRLRSEEDFEELKQVYNPLDPARYPSNWGNLVREFKTRDYPLGIDAWPGFFRPLNVSGPATLRDFILTMHRKPSLLTRMVEFIADFSIRTLGRALKDINFDYAVLREPIADNSGPIVSPSDFERFVIPCYRQIIGVLEEGGVDVIIFSAFGDLKKLIPALLEAGVNGLKCSGTKSSGVNYVQLRRKYGNRIVLIGGIDVESLSRGREAIRREVMSMVPYLISTGGYIPMVDNRVRENVSYGNYCFYRNLIAEVSGTP